VHRHGVRGVDVLDAIDLSVRAARGQWLPGRCRRGCRQEHAERERRELRARERGDANVVDAVLLGLERERCLAFFAGLFAGDFLQLRAHRAVDGDGRVE
jgi:hypothetical protein